MRPLPLKSIAAVGALGVAAVAWWLLRDTQEPSAEPAAAAVLDGTYDLTYELAMDGVAVGGAHKTASVFVAGKLVVTPRNEEGTHWYEARLDAPQLVADETARAVTDFPRENIGAALSKPWVADLDSEGRVTATRFEGKASVAVRGVFAAIASMSQYTRPALSAAAWTTSESELNGDYTANYEASSDRVTKRWRLVGDGDPEDPAATPGYEADGEARFTLENGVVHKVQARQTGAASVGRRDGDNRARFTTTIALTRTGPATPAPQTDRSALTPFTLATVPTSIDRGTPRAFDAIADDIRKTSEAKDWKRRIMAREELTNAVLKDETTAHRTAAEIRKGGLSEPVERSYIEALASAATPAAQEEIAGLMTDPKLPMDTRVRTLGAAALVDPPLETLFKALDSLVFVGRAKDPMLASQASVSLGAATHRSALAAGPAAPVITPRLVDLARTVILGPPGGKPTATLRERSNWLGALGNLADPAGLPIALAALDDESEIIRASAVRALRFLDPGACLPSMQRLLRDDPSIHVRSAIMFSARFMGPEMMETLVGRTLVHDVSEHVRLAAAFTVSQWSLNAPGLRRLLAEALEQEKSAKVQESLRNYLQPNRVAQPFRELPQPTAGVGQ